MIVTDRTRAYEIIAAAVTAVAKLVMVDGLGYKLPFILLAIVGWAVYIAYRLRQKPELRPYWGLTTKGLGESLLRLLPVAVILSAAFLAAGFYFETEVLDWTIIPILLIYPIWGVIQQFLVLGIFGKNLSDGWGGKLPEVAVIFLTALLFGFVHAPAWLLVGATFVLALVYMKLYLKEYNLVALGIYHGVLGGLFYYTVLGRSAWWEVFG